MGLRINTNLASISAQRNMSNVTQHLEGNFARLSSGLRIASAADDAAGLGISEQMRAQIRSYSSAARNVQDGISLVQTAEGALNEVSNILGRMRELAVQAANGTLNDDDRAVIDTEFQQLNDEIDRISGDANFNDIALLSSSASSVRLQVGIDGSDSMTITLEDMSAGGLGVGDDVVSSVAGAQAALSEIDDAIASVASNRGNLGATQGVLQSRLQSIYNARENLSAAESRIRDVDVAAETADLARNQILQQASVSVLAQANSQPSLALSLLG